MEPHAVDCLVVGDSISADRFVTETDKGYYGRLSRWLAAYGQTASIRLGVPGARIDSFLLCRDEIAATPAEVAVVEAGSNDASGYPSFYPTPLPSFEASYRDLVAAIRMANPTVHLVLVGLWRQGEAGRPYDAAIQRIAADTGAVFVSLEALGSNNTLTGPVGVPTLYGPADGFHPNDDGHAAIAQAIKRAIAGWYGYDATAPRTHATAPAGWQRRPVTASISARREDTDVDFVEYSVDDGPWIRGLQARVSGDGRHVLRFRGTDIVGNEERVRRLPISIDSVPPRTSALAAVTARRGGSTRLPVLLVDPPAPRCHLVLQIRSGSRVIQSIAAGRYAPGVHRIRWKATMRPGSYSYRFLATDLAGNRQGRATSARLTIR